MSSEPVTLSLANLDKLPAEISRPRQVRESLSPGILHFGPGNFHRSHQQVYLDRLMNEGRALDWGIVGASIMPGDASLRAHMLDQDLLTTVVAQSADSSEASVTGAMIDYLPVADAPAILAALMDPAIRIVSMTVTEGGYFVDADSGRFDESHTAIKADAANLDAPKTVFGLIVNALRSRRDAGQPAFTVMSCDNLPHNGHVAHDAVVGLARLHDTSLADWIDSNASFPNGMVDRIAPATGPRELGLVRTEHGIADDTPVFCEDYIQWVLEDKFVGGRPPFEQVGVEFVDDVTPFETMKIRILNGGHALIAYPAGLLDIEFAHDAMQHPLISAFLEKVERDEILPIVPPVPATDLNYYLGRVVSRFSNPKIGDTVQRLCFDGSNRQPKFIVPTVRDRLADNATVEGLALGSALWCRYCHGETESGASIDANDPSWELLKATSRAAKDDPTKWLAMRDVYGSVGDNEQFQIAFSNALHALWKDGVEATLKGYLKH